MLFMDGTQKKLYCRGKLLHTHLLLFLYLWDKKKLVTNNKKTFEFLYLSYWMSKLPNYCNCLFYFPISFFLGAIHEKHNFKYLKNRTVNVCKIWFYDVYMYILYYKFLNSYICHSRCSIYCNCLFYFQVGWGGGGVVWGWFYLITSLQKTRRPPSCIVILFHFFWVPCMKNIILNILKMWR
jgi:hypothetical protein